MPENTSIIIDGTGSLDAGSSDGQSAAAAGIGGNDGENAGSITIKNGTVKATGVNGGADIGGGSEASDQGSCYISGGSVNVRSMGPAPQVSASDDTAVYLTTVTLDGINARTSVDSLIVTYDSGSYPYGTGGMYTDTSGKLYLWLPEGASVTGAAIDDTPYSGSVTTITDGSAGTLTVGGHIFTTTKTNDVFDYSNTPESGKMYLRVKTEPDNKEFQIPVCGRTASSTYDIPYDWSVDWGDGNKNTESGTSSFSGGILHTYSESGTYTITITPNSAESAGWFRAFGFNIMGGDGTASVEANKEKLTGFAGVFDDASINFDSTDCLLSQIFHHCKNLTAANVQINADIKKTGNHFASHMFNNCTSLESLPDGFNLPGGYYVGRRCLCHPNVLRLHQSYNSAERLQLAPKYY